jgi:hypothetical protein
MRRLFLRLSGLGFENWTIWGLVTVSHLASGLVHFAVDFFQ